MQKQSIKTITLSRLIQIFFVAIIIVLSLIALSYRNFFQHTVENKALVIAEIIKAGLTSHMKAGIMDKREYFLSEVASVHDIDSIRIIRSDAIRKQFGVRSGSEAKLTDDLRTILASKKPHFIWNDLDSNVIAIIPYVASSQGELNCLKCHNVNDGELLGAITINLNISGYQELVMKYGYAFAAVLLVLAILIVFNMSHVIERYIRKPLSKVIHEGELAYSAHKKIDSGSYESQELDDVVQNINNFNEEVLLKEDDLQKKNQELIALNQEIELTLEEIIMAMGKMEEIRSKDTKNHAKRVAILSRMIAKSYGMSDEEVHLITLSSPLHDIGKVGIADNILNKPGKLNDEEFEVMKTHASLGYEVLRHSKRKVLYSAALIAHSHHEKYDGSGYPQGLKGDEIPLFARIVAIVDVLDALLCKRIYKEAWVGEDVYNLIEKESGKHFEPKLVCIVLSNFTTYEKLIKELS